MDLPTDLQWRELFAISEKIRALEPWRRYTSAQLFMIAAETETEPIFCSVLGNQEEYCGVSLYRGYEALNGFLKILEAGEEPPFLTITANQHCVTVYFAEDNLLGAGDITAMHKGNYAPKVGVLNQIFFRSYAPGFSPWYIDKNEAQSAIANLNIFYNMLMAAKEMSPNFKNGEVVYASDSSGEWQYTTSPLPSFEVEENSLEIRDELMIAKLKRLPRTGKSFEIELSYLPNPVSGKGQLRPIFPRICIIANHDEGTIERQVVLDEDEDAVAALYAMLTQTLKEVGRPRLLIIRKNNILHLVDDLCKKINIPIEERTRLEIIDDFLNMIGNFNPES